MLAIDLLAACVEALPDEPADTDAPAGETGGETAEDPDPGLHLSDELGAGLAAELTLPINPVLAGADVRMNWSTVILDPFGVPVDPVEPHEARLWLIEAPDAASLADILLDGPLLSEQVLAEFVYDGRPDGSVPVSQMRGLVNPGIRPLDASLGIGVWVLTVADAGGRLFAITAMQPVDDPSAATEVDLSRLGGTLTADATLGVAAPLPEGALGVMWDALTRTALGHAWNTGRADTLTVGRFDTSEQVEAWLEGTAGNPTETWQAGVANADGLFDMTELTGEGAVFGTDGQWAVRLDSSLALLPLPAYAAVYARP